ncbi:MAG TPA: YetF domain-containing protein, partial [Chthoniobacterales bacterium]|nr:YetF domain-containing protein [Chthoniobacterales bacterium]
DDRSFTNALVQIASICAAHYLLVILRARWPGIGRIVDGTPLILLERGQWHQQTMKDMLIQDADVMATARDQGLENLEQIEYAVLERNGQISIITKEEK